MTKKTIICLAAALFFCSGCGFHRRVVKKAPEKKAQPSGAEKSPERADKLRSKGDYTAAASKYNEAIKIKKDMWQVWLGLGI